jgi:hypothetical protein
MIPAYSFHEYEDRTSHIDPKPPKACIKLTMGTTWRDSTPSPTQAKRGAPLSTRLRFHLPGTFLGEAAVVEKILMSLGIQKTSPCPCLEFLCLVLSLAVPFFTSLGFDPLRWALGRSLGKTYCTKSQSRIS